jgi:hypothetical protein
MLVIQREPTSAFKEGSKNQFQKSIAAGNNCRNNKFIKNYGSILYLYKNKKKVKKVPLLNHLYRNTKQFLKMKNILILKINFGKKRTVG